MGPMLGLGKSPEFAAPICSLPHEEQQEEKWAAGTRRRALPRQRTHREPTGTPVSSLQPPEREEMNVLPRSHAVCGILFPQPDRWGQPQRWCSGHFTQDRWASR